MKMLCVKTGKGGASLQMGGWKGQESCGDEKILVAHKGQKHKNPLCGSPAGTRETSKLQQVMIGLLLAHVRA